MKARAERKALKADAKGTATKKKKLNGKHFAGKVGRAKA